MVVRDSKGAHGREKIYDDIADAAGTYEYLCLVGTRRIFCHTPIGPICWHAPWCLSRQ